MLSKEAKELISANVNFGALTLDEHRPNTWYKTVKGAMTAGLFRMNEWERCMVGTLEMAKYVDGSGECIVFNGLSVPLKNAATYGFDVPEECLDDYAPSDRNVASDEAYDLLDQLWRDQVEKRLNYDAMPRWRKLFARHP